MKETIIKIFNSLNKILGGDTVTLSGSLFHKLFNDGKEHFIILEKESREITVVFYVSCEYPNQEDLELAIDAYPEYKEWIPVFVINYLSIL